jgi:hypothetical protein
VQQDHASQHNDAGELRQPEARLTVARPDHSSVSIVRTGVIDSGFVDCLYWALASDLQLVLQRRQGLDKRSGSEVWTPVCFVSSTQSWPGACESAGFLPGVQAILECRRLRRVPWPKSHRNGGAASWCRSHTVSRGQPEGGHERISMRRVAVSDPPVGRLLVPRRPADVSWVVRCFPSASRPTADA